MEVLCNSNSGLSQTMSQTATGEPGSAPSRPRTSFPARSRPETYMCTESLFSSISSVISLRSKEPTTSSLKPERSVPSKFSGSTPLRRRSPVAFSSTHHTSSRDSTSNPPASDIRIFTSWDSGSRTENGRGFETSTG